MAVLQENVGLEGERRLDASSLQGQHRARKDKEARLASVLEGEACLHMYCPWWEGYCIKVCMPCMGCIAKHRARVTACHISHKCNYCTPQHSAFVCPYNACSLQCMSCFIDGFADTEGHV